MKKYRFIAFFILAALLLAPTAILIVRGASVGRFPKASEVVEIKVRAAASDDGKTKVISADMPLFRLFFEVLSESERIFASELPKGCEVFDVDFKLSDSTERIRVYFRRSDCSFYVKNSENRYFAFRDPELDLLDTVLPPSKIELCLRSEDAPLFSYPTGAEDTVSDIVLSKWEKLSDIAASKAFSDAVFHLYERVNDTEYVFVQEVTDFTALSDASPDSVVRCVVRWELFEEVDLLHYYLFSLGTD